MTISIRWEAVWVVLVLAYWLISISQTYYIMENWAETDPTLTQKPRFVPLALASILWLPFALIFIVKWMVGKLVEK